MLTNMITSGALYETYKRRSKIIEIWGLLFLGSVLVMRLCDFIIAKATLTIKSRPIEGLLVGAIVIINDPTRWLSNI